MRWKILYRGVSMLQWQAGEALTPKLPYTAFEYEFMRHGESPPRTRGGVGSGATRHPSHLNAAMLHELHQRGFPTSGVSTTPHYHRAKFYAIDRNPQGVVLTLDCERLFSEGVKFFVVRDLLPYPSVPDDDEVILVASGEGPLPSSALVGHKILEHDK